jgi:hypothetical protein
VQVAELVLFSRRLICNRSAKSFDDGPGRRESASIIPTSARRIFVAAP